MPERDRLTACSGLTSFISDEGAASVLLPESPALFEWPGSTRVHSVTLRFGDASAYSVVIDAEDGEHTQSAEAGTHCPP